MEILEVKILRNRIYKRIYIYINDNKSIFYITVRWSVENRSNNFRKDGGACTFDISRVWTTSKVFELFRSNGIYSLAGNEEAR